MDDHPILGAVLVAIGAGNFRSHHELPFRKASQERYRQAQRVARPELRMRPFILVLAAAIGMTGCVTLPRDEKPPQSSQAAAPVGFSSSVRALGVDWLLDRPPADIVMGLRTAATDGSLDVLALSGGGASGAFAAGALVGLNRAHARPQFELVTGVSAGALVAPFAFLGPEWDSQLTDAFVGDRSENLIRRRGILGLFGTSFFRGEPLRQLIDGLVTDAMIREVARESAKGRLLLVATTDLDKSATVVWDLGAIAATGGEPARRLFRDVLVASSSIPGVFPPVMISVSDANGGTYQEMHVDGSVTVPFFIAPEAVLVAPDQPQGTRGGNIYVVVNSELNIAPRTTPINTLSIVARGFLSALSHASRTALAQNATFAQKLGMSFRYTAIPMGDGSAGLLDFDAARMRALFDYASTCAENGQLWLSEVKQALDEAAHPDTSVEPLSSRCPLASRRRS
jgi:predicted acylesterase/phospholipase RssA